MRTAFPYRWVICACGLVTIFISIGLVSNVFSIYLPYIVQQNGFTNTQTGLLTTMRTVAALLSMLGADGYYRRFGLRRGLTLPFFATVAAYLLYGSTRTPAFYYGAAPPTPSGTSARPTASPASASSRIPSAGIRRENFSRRCWASPTWTTQASRVSS